MNSSMQTTHMFCEYDCAIEMNIAGLVYQQAYLTYKTIPVIDCLNNITMEHLLWIRQLNKSLTRPLTNEISVISNRN